MGWEAALTLLIGYLIGGIPTGLLVARQRGVDIRAVGSGNIGATNAFRVLGKRAGATVLIIDLFKGTVACLCAPMIVARLGLGAPDMDTNSLRALAGISAVVGHNFPIWLKFRGGKGIATSAGVLLALAPIGFLGAVGVWLVVFRFTRTVSVASISAAIALPVVVWLAGYPLAMKWISVLLAALAIARHRTNIVRLMQGKEPRISGGEGK